jgi:O-antigen/teichoic acid export membrane protein
MHFIKKILLSQPVLVLIDQAIYSGTNFLLMLFLAQKLDIKNFGIFSTLMLFVYLTMSITSALIIQPFQVSYIKVLLKKEYFIFLFLGILISTTVIMVIVKLLFLVLPIFSVYDSYGNVMSLFVVGLLIQDFFRKLFLGLTQILKTLIIDSTFLFLVIILFYFYKDAIQLSNALWIITIANLVSSFTGIIFIIKNYEKPRSWKLFLDNHIMQGKWLVYTAFLQWGSSNFFILVSGIYLGIEALGALRLVQSLFGVLSVALISIENYMLPKMVYFHNESVLKAKKYLLDISLMGMVAFSLILTLVFIFSNEIIILAGGIKYQEYGYVVKIMAILYFFIFLNYPIRIAIKVLVLNEIFFYGYVISFIFSVVSFHFFLKYFGLYGAVAGLTINQFVMTIYWQNQLKKNQFQLWI